MNVHEPTAATAATTAISRTQTEEANISSTSTSAASNDIDDDFEKLEQNFQVDNIEDLIVGLEKDIENQGEGSASSGSKPSSPDKQQTHGANSKQGASATFLSNTLSTTAPTSSFFKSAINNTPSSTKNTATSSTTGTINSSSSSSGGNSASRVFDSHSNNQIQSHQRKQIFSSTDSKSIATDQRSKTYANSKVATSSTIEDKNEKDIAHNVASTTRQSSSLPSSRTRCTEGEREGLKMKIMRDVKPGKREHKIVSPDLNKLPKVASNSTCLSSNNKSITTSTSDTRDQGSMSTEISQAKSTPEISLKDNNNMPISRENKISIDNPKVTVIEKNGCQTSTSGDNNFLASRKKNLEVGHSLSCLIF